MWKIVTLVLSLLMGGCVMTDNEVNNIELLEAEVRSTEAAFAKTMADRDFDAFKRFLADDTVFFAGESPLRGSAAVAAAWQPFFDGGEAPFSWAPATVAVEAGGALALSSGPVFGPDGKQVAVFNSIWRRETDGTWRIVFDKGGQYCPEQAEQG